MPPGISQKLVIQLL